MKDVTNPLSIPSVIVCRIFLSSLNLYNTSLISPSVQMIFSILLQRHISNLQGISDLVSEVPRCHAMYCTKEEFNNIRSFVSSVTHINIQTHTHCFER